MLTSNYFRNIVEPERLLPLSWVLLSVLAYFWPNQLWAFSAFRILPVWLQIIYGLLLSAMVLAPGSRLIEHALEMGGSWLFVRRNRACPWIVAVLSMLLAALAWNPTLVC